MPRVSVVIPAFNAGAYLAPTLESVVRGTFADVEAVVVDDGSSDNTAEVAARFMPIVRVIRQRNRGMSRSRNVGVKSGDSEFVALLDSDDIWHLQKLELQIALLEQRPDVAFCYTEFSAWDGSAQIPAAFLAPPTGELDEGLSGWIYHHLLLTNWVLPSSLVFRRSAWDALGEFVCEDQKTDDWEFTVRASRDYRFAKLRDSMVLYRQTPGSLSRRVERENSMEKMRSALIDRYGLTSPDGTPVDQFELRRRRYNSRRDFADANCARGDLAIGLKEFGRLMLDGGDRVDTALRLAMSLRRRVLGPGSPGTRR